MSLGPVTLTLASYPENASVGLTYSRLAAAGEVMRVWRYDPDRDPVLIRNLSGGRPPTFDFEAPLNVQVGYAASILADTADPVAPADPTNYITIVVPDNEAWVKDPGYSGIGLRVECVTVIPPKTWEPNAGLFRPIGRKYPVAVSDVRTSHAGSFEFITKTYAEASKMEKLIEDGGTLFLQTGPLYGYLNEHVMMGSVTSAPLQIQKLEARRWSFEYQTVQPPVGDFETAFAWSYSEMAADGAWTSYAQLAAKFNDYYDLSINKRLP